MTDPLKPRDLARLARAAPGKAGDVLGRLPLERQVDAVLAVPPADRVSVLLAAPRPMRLVRSIPDGDLYLTIREAGVADAVPLLGLASPAQLTHLLDLESWRGDRFDAARAGAWTAVLLEAGESALRRLARNADDALLALLFHRWARAHAIETDDQTPVHGSGETESGDDRGFVSPCGYYRFDPLDTRQAAAVRRLAELLFLDDPERYFRLLWATVSESEGELEEDGLRWRASRLEEHGYPPYDEATQIYAPPLATRRAPAPAVVDAGETDAVAPRWGEREVRAGGALARALEGLTLEEAETARRELVATAARIVVADGLDAGDPASHHAAARKAAALVQVGIETRVREQGLPEAEVLRGYPVVELFRHGHERVAGLARRARAWFTGGWPQGREARLEWLEPPLRARLVGLLADRPVHLDLDGDATASRVRDFETMSEIEEARAALDVAGALGEVFGERLEIDLERVAAAGAALGHPVGFSTLLLTALAWHATGRGSRVEPLPPAVVADFLRTVASRRTAAPDAPERALDAWIAELAARSLLDARECAVTRAFGRGCLERLAAECGSLDPGIPVDGRHVSCLLLEPKEGLRVDG